MFLSSSEVGQDFTISISGDNSGPPFNSEFTIKVLKQKDPISVKHLVDQRVKLGNSLDYQIPEDAFIDQDIALDR